MIENVSVRIDVEKKKVICAGQRTMHCVLQSPFSIYGFDVYCSVDLESLPKPNLKCFPKIFTSKSSFFASHFFCAHLSSIFLPYLFFRPSA